MEPNWRLLINRRLTSFLWQLAKSNRWAPVRNHFKQILEPSFRPHTQHSTTRKGLVLADSPLEATIKENCWRRASSLKVYLQAHWRWSVSRVLGNPLPQRVLNRSLMELSIKRRGERKRGWHCLHLKTHLSLIASSPIDYPRPLTPFPCDPFTLCVIPLQRLQTHPFVVFWCD